MQHLFTPGGEAILRLHPLQEFQQPLLFFSAFAAPHHVLLTVYKHTNSFKQDFPLRPFKVGLQIRHQQIQYERTITKKTIQFSNLNPPGLLVNTFEMSTNVLWVYLSEGLLRLFFSPMLLRRALWFLRASSQMPIPLPEGLLPPTLPSKDPAPHITDASLHCTEKHSYCIKKCVKSALQ